MPSYLLVRGSFQCVIYVYKYNLQYISNTIMVESQAIALLADPNKVDLDMGETKVQDEMPTLSTPPKVSTEPSQTSGINVVEKKQNVLDLIDDTDTMFKKPIAMEKPTQDTPPPPSTNVLDLSNIEIKEEPVDKPPELTPSQIREKKERILYDIERLRRRGIRFPRSFTMASDLEEMEAEYNRIKKDMETEQAVRFQRKMLMTCVSGIEMLNNRFDPFDIQLDGWSESVNENVGDYDEVFEELYEKYRGSGKMAPELRLLFMLGGSALMFHMTKSMFSSASPQVADVLRSNPNLAAQVSQAAMAQNMGGMSRMMGMAQGGGSAPAQPPPPPRGVVIPPPADVDDVLRELQGDSGGPSQTKTKKTRRPKKSSGGSTGIDTLSLSLNN